MKIITKILFFICLLAVIAVTSVSIFWSREPEGLPSAELTTQETTDGDRVRIDYVDSNGQVTYATDKHYATLIRTYEDDHVILEEYFDAEGKPAVLTSGYCAVSKSYNTEGLVDVFTYLGTDGKPVMTTSGFSSIHRSYNDRRLADTDTYYDVKDDRVRHAKGFYGYQRSYDDHKRVNGITYLDAGGSPADCRLGYAQVVRTFNDAGKIAYEFYFHSSGAPATASQGEYGVYREYDEEGRVTVTTYLDSSGNPMELKRGYATTVHSYTAEGELDSIRYYDCSGNPVTTGRDRYGVKYEDGQVYYLDQDGNQTMRLDHYLNMHPVVVLISGVLLTVLAMSVKGKGRTAFLLLYLLFIGMITMWFREPGEARSHFELFWSYRQFLVSSSLRQEILNNVWLFLPLGAVLYKPGSWRWILPVLFSVAIESVQYYTGIGLCELDDVLSNSIGGLIGYGLAAAFLKDREMRRRGKISTGKNTSIQ